MIVREQRYPQCTDDEMTKVFESISLGYCWEQAAARVGLCTVTLDNTLCSDDLTLGRLIDLSMIAGANIRAGTQPPPHDRWDGLYD